jgi:hypothetical protein
VLLELVDGPMPAPLGFTPGTGAWWGRVASPSAFHILSIPRAAFIGLPVSMLF